ncbi:hypothetical protein [Bradyrhizobium sp. CB1650]|uniref:hypothetical protein n=1 Tax=Bradyrhizobium sp. CB1650 TaxID=3039153 RepID=UPI00325FBE19
MLRRLGIDFKALRKARPDLSTVSTPGFASTINEWRAFEAVIEASSGVFTSGMLGGLSRVLMGVNPPSHRCLWHRHTARCSRHRLRYRCFRRESAAGPVTRSRCLLHVRSWRDWPTTRSALTTFHPAINQYLRKDESRLPDANCKRVGTDLRRRPGTRRSAPMA